MDFSVIVPTRNRPQFLSEAVASVLSQSIDDIEVLVVNDGDGQITLPPDSRLHIIDNKQRGSVVARNTGVAHARGNYIAFLDDDDIWIDPHHLAYAKGAFANGAAFTFANGIMQFPDEPHPRLFNLNADAQSLERDNTILVSAVCYRRDLHITLGTFDETNPYYWDWDWYLRVARAKHALVHIHKTVVDIRIHPQNMSGDSNVAARQDGLNAFSVKHNLAEIPLKNHSDFVR